MPSSPPVVFGQAFVAGGGAGAAEPVSVLVSVVVVSAVVVWVVSPTGSAVGIGPADSAPSSPQPTTKANASSANEVAKSVFTVVSFIGYLHR